MIEKNVLEISKILNDASITPTILDVGKNGNMIYVI